MQSAVTIGLVLFFGSSRQAFERLVVFTGPFYWGFIGLVILALVVMRSRGQLKDERYRVPLYPLPAVLFSIACVWMCYSAFRYAWDNRAWEGLWAIILFAIGIVLAVVDASGSAPADTRQTS
jgi:amino acid transporter